MGAIAPMSVPHRALEEVKMKGSLRINCFILLKVKSSENIVGALTISELSQNYLVTLLGSYALLSTFGELLLTKSVVTFI